MSSQGDSTILSPGFMDPTPSLYLSIIGSGERCYSCLGWAVSKQKQEEQMEH